MTPIPLRTGLIFIPHCGFARGTPQAESWINAFRYARFSQFAAPSLTNQCGPAPDDGAAKP